MACRLSFANGDEGLAIPRNRVAEAQDPHVTIDFNGQAEPSQLPPEHQVPGHADEKADGDGQQLSVVSVEMGPLMRDHQFLLAWREFCQPARHDNLWTQKPHNSRT